MAKPTEKIIKITTKQHHEFTFNGLTKKRSIDGRDTVYIVEDSLDTFTIIPPNEKLNEDQAMLYIAVSMLSLDPKKGYNFEIIEDKLNNVGMSVYQRDGVLESNRLTYNHSKTNEICESLKIPKKEGTNEYLWTNSSRVQVTVYALEKAFKMYDSEQEQNEIVVLAEQVAPNLVVTTFEDLPSFEKTVEIQKSQPPKDDYQQLLDNIEKSIQYVSDDKLPYHDRAQKNTVLCVYIDRLAQCAYDANIEAVRLKNIAEKEYYRHYYEFLEDPKNTAENGRKPSDASAKAYATNLTLDLYCDSELSEKLARHLSDRIKTLDSISKSVLQEISNAKKIEEQSKNQK